MLLSYLICRLFFVLVILDSYHVTVQEMPPPPISVQHARCWLTQPAYASSTTKVTPAKRRSERLSTKEVERCVPQMEACVVCAVKTHWQREGC